MAQYINKSALVAEIERRRKEAELNCGGYKSYDEHRCDNCTVGFYDEFLEIINTFEVKEVDLENELDEWVKYGPHTSYPWCTIPDAIKITAEHFFELGLKAQKGE